MIRITTIFLCLLLAAAAAGRYRAEESVRKARSELEKLETSRLEELRTIQMLRAETAYLENPERLAKIAEERTDLRPSDRDQILSARQFAAAVGDEEAPAEDFDAPLPGGVIANAIAMAEAADAQ